MSLNPTHTTPARTSRVFFRLSFQEKKSSRRQTFVYLYFTLGNYWLLSRNLSILLPSFSLSLGSVELDFDGKQGDFFFSQPTFG